MKLDRLQQLVIGAARQAPPRDDVPHGFEQRIMARLRSSTDPLAVWSAWLWRAALSACAVAAVAWAVGLTSVVLLPDEDRTDDLDTPAELASGHLEDALFASADSGPETW